ncbi:hypothetical protein [Aquirufa novilacunae]|uniref:Uncharacterized protein n=1 Tax=Aquirufa novilacunae TaxID=3139305 RepID=A0ABW8U314_9BACT
MQTFAQTVLFVCLTFMGYAQGKHYKNQINKTLTEKVNLEIKVEEKKTIPSSQTPKYQQVNPNIQFADTSKTKKNNASYKQHGGKPN